MALENLELLSQWISDEQEIEDVADGKRAPTARKDYARVHSSQLKAGRIFGIWRAVRPPKSEIQGRDIPASTAAASLFSSASLPSPIPDRQISQRWRNKVLVQESHSYDHLDVLVDSVNVAARAEDNEEEMGFASMCIG